jgi:hypothetical protein
MLLKNYLFILACLFTSSSIFAQNIAKDSSDKYIVSQLKSRGEKTETNRVIVWYFKEEVTEPKITEFVKSLETGLKALEEFTERKFDEIYYGQSKIEYFISRYTTASHVFNGYSHYRGEKKPYVFFSAFRLKDNTIPYLHETAHLILGNYTSLWMREGTAEWVAKEVAKKLGVGHTTFYGNNGAHEDAHLLASRFLLDESGKKAIEQIGKSGMLELKDKVLRMNYYIASTSFVEFLASQLNKASLFTIYDAEDTNGTIEKSLNKDFGTIKNEWIELLIKVSNTNK